MTQEERDDAKLDLDRQRVDLERRKFDTDSRLREQELELKRKDQSRAGWSNPLVVAIFAAAIAAGGNAVVSIVNGIQQRGIEDRKSEQARVLEMIKTGDTEKAAENLRFLLDAGLIDNEERAGKVKAFLDARQPGTGPALPSAAIVGGIVGLDDAVDVGSLSETNAVRAASRSVGRLKVAFENGTLSECTAFLVSSDLALTAAHCLKGAKSAILEYSDSGALLRYEVQLPPVAEETSADNFAVLRVSGKPGDRVGTLALSPEAPKEREGVAAVYFRGSERKLAVTAPDCRVIRVENRTFDHGCDTGAGSSGAPILTRDGRYVLGMHFARSPLGGEATRSDVILQAIQRHAGSK